MSALFPIPFPFPPPIDTNSLVYAFHRVHRVPGSNRNTRRSTAQPRVEVVGVSRMRNWEGRIFYAFMAGGVVFRRWDTWAAGIWKKRQKSTYAFSSSSRHLWFEKPPPRELRRLTIPEGTCSLSILVPMPESASNLRGAPSSPLGPSSSPSSSAASGPIGRVRPRSSSPFWEERRPGNLKGI